MEGAYHGHTGMLIDLSPYKFRGPGGKGTAEDWVLLSISYYRLERFK